MMTDFAFSSIRDWFLGNTIVAPSGTLAGTGSGAVAFSDTFLGSPLDPTRRGFQSESGIGYTIQWEGLVDASDIITGSIVREMGIIALSGGRVWFRALTSEIELNGSVIITPIINLEVR